MESRQAAVDRRHQRRERGWSVPGAEPVVAESATEEAQRAARATLRAQIGRLEGEISALLGERFPFLPLPAHEPAPSFGPRLLDLGELERTRDRLAGRLAELRALARRRNEHERRARELLAKMRLEPGRYRNWRLPVRDLGEPGCGVWEVRPRLGLIGMLAGWWELKLSSGCP